MESEKKPRGLFMKRGTLVYDAGPGPVSDVMEWIAEDRKARLDALVERMREGQDRAVSDAGEDSPVL